MLGLTWLCTDMLLAQFTLKCQFTWGGGLLRGGCLIPGVGGGIPSCTEADPPVNRMTDRCKTITLPQTSFAGGNESNVLLSPLLLNAKVLMILITAVKV